MPSRMSSSFATTGLAKRGRLPTKMLKGGGRLTNEEIEDILFVITYRGEAPPLALLAPSALHARSRSPGGQIARGSGFRSFEMREVGGYKA
jgi:hypothetical protein